jgi:hypothetical protein
MSNHVTVAYENIRAESTAPNIVNQGHVADNLQVLFTENRRYYLLTFDVTDSYYIDDYGNSLWGITSPSDVLEMIEDEGIEFLMYYTKYRFLKDYGGIGEDIKQPSFDMAKRRIFYNEGEESKLISLYGAAEPQLAFSVEQPLSNNSDYQNSIEVGLVSYDSLSSLGQVSQESFTITTTTGSISGLITEEVETISDVGGTISRDREITSSDVRVGSSTTQTVTTSGY